VPGLIATVRALRGGFHSFACDDSAARGDFCYDSAEFDAMGRGHRTGGENWEANGVVFGISMSTRVLMSPPHARTGCVCRDRWTLRSIGHLTWRRLVARR